MVLEIKKWDEYSQSEKEVILLQWWRECVEPLQQIDNDAFKSLLSTHANEVFSYAVSSFVLGYSELGQDSLLNLIRQNKVSRYLKTFSAKELPSAVKRFERFLVSRLVIKHNAALPPTEISQNMLNSQLETMEMAGQEMLEGIDKEESKLTNINGGSSQRS